MTNFLFIEVVASVYVFVEFPMTPSILPDPVNRLLRLLQSDSSRLIIGLAGLPGASKSTLAAQWTAEVNALTQPETMIALGMDGFHLTKAQLQQMPNAEEAFARRGAPWTFDPAALAQRLQRLRAAAGQKSIAWPDFQHDIGDPVENALVIAPSVRLVLVEGLYLLHQKGGWAKVSHSFDERWYLDTPLDIAMQRVVERHMRVWNWTREAATLRAETNDRHNADIVHAARGCADFILTAG